MIFRAIWEGGSVRWRQGRGNRFAGAVVAPVLANGVDLRLSRVFGSVDANVIRVCSDNQDICDLLVLVYVETRVSGLFKDLGL